MYVKRNVERSFDKLAGIYNIIAIVGARQSGKTTLLKKKLEETNGKYVSFDDPDARELFDQDVKRFEKQYLSKNKVTGLDEVQYCKDAGIKLKYLADKGYKLWVTSSSEILLAKDVLSYLVGRVSILRLYPFSLEEFLRSKKLYEMTETAKSRAIWEHIYFGGYPKVVLTEDTEIKKILLKDIFETLLLKDVSRNFRIEDINSLERLARYLAINVGNVISYEEITNSLEISFPTLKKYLDAMERSYIIKQVKPYFTNKSKELSKRPKVYFIDTGLRNVVAKAFGKDVEGRLFENYVFTELIKYGYEPKYWRTKSKAEVDFVIEKEFPIPIEVKLLARNVSSGLKTFIKKYEPDQAYVVFLKGEPAVTEINGCKVKFIDIFSLKNELGNKNAVQSRS